MAKLPYKKEKGHSVWLKRFDVIGTRVEHLNLKQLIWNSGPRVEFSDLDTGQGAC
jgi:hypothetical protein